MPGHVALGTWSGGRFLRFGEAIEEQRLEALLRPGHGISTLITADAYGAGDADRVVGGAVAGVPRDEFTLVGAIGHDFYEGERDGPRGYPRFTDPRLRGPDEYASYVRMAVERSLERCGVDAFDVLLLHNPDRRGFESPEVWEALRAVRDAGMTRALGLAPGPANGFTLDAIRCFERYGELIDWAMLILNPFEPWPGELALDAAARHGVSVITRVVDYGGLFHDDVLPGHELAPGDHRGFRPDGWVEAGRDAARAHSPDRRPPRAHDAPARVRLEPGPRGGGGGGSHPDPGAGTRREADRGEARRAGRGSPRESAERRGERGHPRGGRQHRHHAAEGGHARSRGRGATRPLGGGPGARRGGATLRHRPRARPAPNAGGTAATAEPAATGSAAARSAGGRPCPPEPPCRGSRRSA